MRLPSRDSDGPIWALGESFRPGCSTSFCPFPIPEVDLPGIVLQLERESAVSAVMREGRMALGCGPDRRANLANNLAAGDPVMFVKENVGVFGTVAVGGEGDQ